MLKNNFYRAASPELAQKETYSFKTIHNIEAWGADFEPTIRTSMKYWNMAVQYWLAVYVYKRFPIKAYRSLTIVYYFESICIVRDFQPICVAIQSPGLYYL